MNIQRDEQRGFTVIELMAAIAIIAALVVIAIPAYQSYQNKARSAEAVTFLSAGQIAEKSFFQAEKSYTACLPSIVGAPVDQQLYYAVGFNLNSTATYRCGPNNDQSCLQKCFSDSNRCKTTPDPCSASSYSVAAPNGVAFTSNALPTNIDFYGTLTPGGSYYSSIGTNDFEIVAATDESQFSKNEFLEKLYPSAYAASWKVYAIGPAGGVYLKNGNNCHLQCQCGSTAETIASEVCYFSTNATDHGAVYQSGQDSCCPRICGHYTPNVVNVNCNNQPI